MRGNAPFESARCSAAPAAVLVARADGAGAGQPRGAVRRGHVEGRVDVPPAVLALVAREPLLDSH